MRSFKSNENIHKKEDGSYYVVSATKASSVTLIPILIFRVLTWTEKWQTVSSNTQKDIIMNQWIILDQRSDPTKYILQGIQ